MDVTCCGCETDVELSICVRTFGDKGYPVMTQARRFVQRVGQGRCAEETFVGKLKDAVILRAVGIPSTIHSLSTEGVCVKKKKNMIHESYTLVYVPHQSGIPAIGRRLNVYHYYWVRSERPG